MVVFLRAVLVSIPVHSFRVGVLVGLYEAGWLLFVNCIVDASISVIVIFC